MIAIAQRLEGIGEYYFSQKLREIDEMRRNGMDVINLGIGSPDLPPDPDVIDALAKAASGPNNHAYQSYKGAPALRKAMADWYQRTYNVVLDSEKEILPLIGSKEGIMHLCMTYLNPGDEVLVPNPGYPTYRSTVALSGGICRDYKLTAESKWLPDLDTLAQEDLSKVKMMWVNYPHMPSGTDGSLQLFDQLVAFGKAFNILICHDNPYSLVLNPQPLSILQAEGAKEVCIELNSLSKSHNMAGWRVGMMCAAPEHINNVLRFKSNMDSGMFLPVQLAAAKALTLSESWFLQLTSAYTSRRDLALEILRAIGAIAESGQVGMFLWARVPATFKDGYKCSDHFLQHAHVFITPGGIFGTEGNNYIRISLCSTSEVLQNALQRIKKVV